MIEPSYIFCLPLLQLGTIRKDNIRNGLVALQTERSRVRGALEDCVIGTETEVVVLREDHISWRQGRNIREAQMIRVGHIKKVASRRIFLVNSLHDKMVRVSVVGGTEVQDPIGKIGNEVVGRACVGPPRHVGDRQLGRADIDRILASRMLPGENASSQVILKEHSLQHTVLILPFKASP